MTLSHDSVTPFSLKGTTVSLGNDPFEVKDTDKIAKIKGTITFADGEKVRFQMTGDTDIRWGNSSEILGRAVLPCEEMARAISTEELWENE